MHVWIEDDDLLVEDGEFTLEETYGPYLLENKEDNTNVSSARLHTTALNNGSSNTSSPRNNGIQELNKVLTGFTG